MNKKAVALFSGGLDSTLAIKLMLGQGIDVHALNFLTVFCTCTSKGCMHQATKAAFKGNEYNRRIHEGSQGSKIWPGKRHEPLH